MYLLDRWVADVFWREQCCSVGLALKGICGEHCYFVICFCLISVFKLPHKKMFNYFTNVWLNKQNIVGNH